VSVRTPVPTTLWEALELRSRVSADEHYVTCDDTSASVGELRDLALGLAGGFHALGLVRGDRVAIVAESSVEVLVAHLACSRLGLVAVPINIFLKGDFLRYQLEHSGAVAAVVDQPGLTSVSALEKLPDLRHTVLIAEGSSPDEGPIPWAQVIASDPPPPMPAMSRADHAAIIYTSGTTGRPKGCIIPHGNFTVTSMALNEVGFVRMGDKLITPAPMFHMGFLGGMFASTLCAGATLHTMRRFQASTFLDTARQVGATVIYAVGTIGMLLLAQPRGPRPPDPGRLRIALLPPLSPASQIEFEERFGIPVLGENYGQSEFNVIAAAHVDQPRRRGSAGVAVSHAEVAVVDESGSLVAPGEDGEIVVRPRKPDVMFQGYWKDPDATLGTWRNLWHHTGDVGRLDIDGTLWITDRKKDVIRRRGENVSSVQVEETMRRLPAIEQVAVHAVPSDVGDDEIKACIVLKEGATFDPKEMFAALKAVMPYFSMPRYVEVLDAFPVNAVGRVQKQVLRDRGISNDTIDFEILGLTVDRAERRAGGPGPQGRTGEL